MVATDNSSSTNPQTTKTTKTTAKAAAAAETVQYSSVTFESGNIRYWDDAYGRNTKLSIYAVAVPNKTIGDNSPLSKLGGEAEVANSWGTSSSNSLSWTLTNTNTNTDKLAEEDLVYSNNIQETQTDYNKVNGVYRYDFTKNSYPDYSATGLTAGQMQFALKTTDVTDGPGKFDRGNLNFVHALSRVTIKVKYGSEFGESEAFAEPTLINMPYKGTFDVKTGTFSATTEGQSDASKDKSNVAMATASNTNDESIKKLCVGQVLPGCEISSSSDANFLSFKIGSNVYYVTQASVFKALNITENSSKLTKKTDDDNTIVMTQGQNYVLTITVSKTGVNNLTATLADWTTIEGSAERNNAYLNFTFSDYATNSSTKNFTLYRSKYTYENPVTGTGYTANYDWNKGYSNNAATLTEPTGDSKVWKTAWYWDSNKDFYHFRMVGKGSGADAKALDIKSEGTGDSQKEYFEIKSGATDGNYRWGAPMAKSVDTDQTLTYSTTNGFDAVSNGGSDSHHISAAIGATNDNIHLTEVNTLAKIVVNLATSEGDNKVTFNGTDNKTTTVELMNIYTDGKVYMGNGLVVTSGSRSATDAKMTEPTEDSKGYTYYVIPQALKEGTSGSETYVAFKITTPDGNVYYVKEKLSEIKPTSVKQGGTNVSIGQTTNDAIAYWYPNCTYTYTFKLTKAGINTITATLVPYTEITAADTDINLED